MDELKPCPMCGGTDLYSERDDDSRAFGECWKVECARADCGCKVSGLTTTDALFRWNRRTEK